MEKGMKTDKVALIWGRSNICLRCCPPPPPPSSLGVSACMDVAAAPDDSLWRASFPADHTAGGAWNEVSVSFTPSFLPTFIKLRLCVQALTSNSSTSIF